MKCEERREQVRSGCTSEKKNSLAEKWTSFRATHLGGWFCYVFFFFVNRLRQFYWVSLKQRWIIGQFFWHPLSLGFTESRISPFYFSSFGGVAFCLENRIFTQRYIGPNGPIETR